MKKVSKLVKSLGLVAALALGFVGLANQADDDSGNKGGLCKAFGCGGGGTGGDPEDS